MKVGIISVVAESNTFLPAQATLATFRRDRFLVGEDIRRDYAHGHHEVSGFLQGMEKAGHQAVPLVMVSAGPCGVIADEALDAIWKLIVEQMERHGPFDAILAAPHGAAVGVGARHDLDGWWLTELRRKVGPRTPIVATIDPHCNLTPAMVAACQAVIAYRENPHVDQRQRGLEAAALLERMLRGEVRPTMQASFPAVQINIEAQGTREEPMLTLTRELDRIRALPGVLSASVVLGYPYADVPEMGTSFIVVTDNNPKLARSLADGLGAWLVTHRQRYVGHLLDPEAAVSQLFGPQKPVGLLDMGDNMGGGAPADSTVLAHLFHRLGRGRVFVCLTDPSAVQAARKAGVGAKLRLKMGGCSPVSPAVPLEAEVEVKGLYDGKYQELEPRHGGQIAFDMGPSAVVSAGCLTVMLTSERAFPGSLKQMTCCDLRAEDFDVLILKGVHSPVAAYAPVCAKLIRVNTPGVTTADMVRLLVYHRRRRPLFPFEAAS